MLLMDKLGSGLFESRLVSETKLTIFYAFDTRCKDSIGSGTYLKSERDLKRILYILHMGLVEIRKLALSRNAEQIADLADALEIVPVLCLDESEGTLRECLKAYSSRYEHTLISDEMWDESVYTDEIVESTIRGRILE